MKQLLVIAILPFLLSFTFSKDVVPPSNEDKATIVFYRKGQFAGALQNYNVYVNGMKLCKISNGKFFKYQISPGEIYLTSKAGGVEVFKKKENFSMDVEAGETYYIECNLKRSLTRYRMEFTEVTANTAKKMMSKLEEDNCMDELMNE